jgi:cyclase
MVKQMEPASLPLITNYNFRVPTITFTDKLTLYVGKHSFQLVNFPGHTKSQLAVYIPEEKVLFTSDNVVCGTMPYIMSPALPFEWIESLRRMQQLDVKVVVPGHGEICDKAYLAEMVADIESWINAVSNAIDKGMDLEQIQSKVSMLDRYTRSTTPVERLAQTQRINLASLYERLKGKKEA